eukprot:scaffold22294_cov36-Phaeocystis_antarctica.AAC.3
MIESESRTLNGPLGGCIVSWQRVVLLLTFDTPCPISPRGRVTPADLHGVSPHQPAGHPPKQA